MDTDYYMGWWMRGANGSYGGRERPPAIPDDNARRAYEAGRVAYLGAERAERERISGVCECCHGEGHRDWIPCHPCGGSGYSQSRRSEP